MRSNPAAAQIVNTKKQPATPWIFPGVENTGSIGVRSTDAALVYATPGNNQIKLWLRQKGF